MLNKIYVVENMVPIPNEAFISMHDCDNLLVFVGKMNYEPNIIAVTHFAEHIFPALRQIHPDLTFLIVGAHPTDKVKQLAQLPGISVTGYVEEIEPYLQKATIVVAPMLTGAGVQNKIIQAMSYGCCVVTTPIGAEGLHLQKEEIGVFDDEKSMISGMLNLLKDKELRKQKGAAARQYVINNLSEEIVVNQFWKFISAGETNYRTRNEK